MSIFKWSFGAGNDEGTLHECLSCGSKRARSDGNYIICPDCGAEWDVEEYDIKAEGLSYEDVYPSEEEVLNRDREDSGDGEDYGEVYDV